MVKEKSGGRPWDGASRTSGPSKEHSNPRKKTGNPTRGGEIFGKWRKPKTK
jgi:hypothetical protein